MLNRVIGLLIISSMLLVGCDIAAAPAVEVSTTDTDNVVSIDTYEEVSEDTADIETSVGIVYRNDKLGFELTLPEYWVDSYVIYEEDDRVDICFKGSCDIGRNPYTDNWTIYLISLVRTQAIGNKSGYITKEVGILPDSSKLVYEMSVEKIEDMQYYLLESHSLNAELLELLIKDKQQHKKMLKDVDTVLKTFKPVTE